MDINDLVNYKITAIRSPLSLVSFAIPCKILDAGEDFRIANIHFVKKEDIADISIEEGKIIIHCKSDDFIALTLADEQD